jgi:hypothetical protein
MSFQFSDVSIRRKERVSDILKRWEDQKKILKPLDPNRSAAALYQEVRRRESMISIPHLFFRLRLLFAGAPRKLEPARVTTKIVNVDYNESFSADLWHVSATASERSIIFHQVTLTAWLYFLAMPAVAHFFGLRYFSDTIKDQL